MTATKFVDNLEIAIDLGSDTVKVAYAYNLDGEVEYGKLAPCDVTGSTIVPAIAYYDEDNTTWIFGSDVYKKVDKSFVTVVKIKALLSLLLARKEIAVTQSNSEYYFKKKSFPKFYFPNRKKLAEDFAEAERLEMTFEGNVTPQKVCEQFFEYLIKETVIPAIGRLQKHKRLSFRNIYYSLVYPAKAGKEYVKELERLVSHASSSKLKKVLSSTRALGLFAYHRGVLKKDNAVSIFDMGEEDISVAKLTLNASGNVIIDGVDGHSEPREIGGNDFDYALRDFVEQVISGRATVGAPPAGEDGYVSEKGLHATQFLTLNEIKKTKTAFSLDDEVYEAAFEDGVTMSIQRDVVVQTSVTREDFLKCAGITSNSGVAGEIACYIIEELKRSINRDVKKVVLSGGVTETYGLIEYINKQLKRAKLNVEVVTFDDWRSDDDTFTILSNEDSTYAPAVGGAIVALKGYELKTAVALSYGTWLYSNRYNKKILDVFLRRGTVLPAKGGEYFTEANVDYKVGFSKSVPNEEIFSTTFGKSDDIIDEPGSAIRRKMEKEIDLKVVSGGANKGEILYYCKINDSLQRVEIQGRLEFKEGVRIDADGRATPFIENNLDKNGRYNTITVRPIGSSGYARNARFEDIVLKFNGVDDFDVENSD